MSNIVSITNGESVSFSQGLNDEFAESQISRVLADRELMIKELCEAACFRSLVQAIHPLYQSLTQGSSLSHLKLMQFQNEIVRLQNIFRVCGPKAENLCRYLYIATNELFIYQENPERFQSPTANQEEGNS